MKSCCTVSQKKLIFRKWFKARTRESWKKYKERRQCAKTDLSQDKECKVESWLVTWTKREPRPDLQNCKADGKRNATHN